MTIIIDNWQNKVEVTKEMEALLKGLIQKTLELEGEHAPMEIGIILADNEQIRELNRKHRGIDRETDVLSFPMIEYEDYCDSEVEQFRLEEMETEMDHDSQEILLGDIVISLEKALQQAEEYGHEIEREIGFLTVHGMLHLLGYDHMEKEDEKIMRQREEEVLHSFHLIRGQ
ncbi:MAG: rRNA maturation RNase YbeY [Clostridia bacterium]|jgi:probable rRNA maturation factor